MLFRSLHLQTPDILCSLLPIQLPVGPTLPRSGGHKLHQLLHPEQAGHGVWHDGLPVRQVRALHHRLRGGGAGETGAKVQSGTEVGREGGEEGDELFSSS